MTSWELLAARPGGTVAALILAAGGPIFAGTSVGLLRSNDGGRTWTPTGLTGLTPPIEAAAASPAFSSNQTLYAGTPSGLYRSRDGGRRWQPILVGSRVLAVVVAAAGKEDDLLFVGTETDGILRSEDGGRSWTGANPGLLDLTVLALALSPRFTTDRTAFAATASGLYRTRNGGRAWRPIEALPGETAVQCLALSPAFANDRLVLAGTETDGLLRSDDGGATWEQVEAIGAQGVSALAFAERAAEPPLAAAATLDGVYLSTDGGASWRLLEGERDPLLSLVFVDDQAGPALLAGLGRRGVARFELAADRWQPAIEGLQANLLVALRLSPDFPRNQTLALAGLEDGLALSRDGGTSWQSCQASLPEATVFDLLWLPSEAPTGPTILAATSIGLRRSDDDGRTWQQVAGEPGEQPVRILAPCGGLVLAALQNRTIWLAEDGGRSWRQLVWPTDGEVLSLGCSPDFEHDRTLFVGSGAPDPAVPGVSDLVLWRSADAGQSWQRWLLARGPNVLPIAVPPTYPLDQQLFAGLGGRVVVPRRDAMEVRAGERRPIWRGVSLPGELPTVAALALSPAYASDRTLFAATSEGLVSSQDGGASFRSWAEGLPAGPIVSLAVSPAYETDRLVFALALGGTLWRRRA